MTELEELKEKVDLASKATEELPEPLKTEGFKIILNNLLDDKIKEKYSKTKISLTTKSKTMSSDITNIINNLNRSNYSDLNKLIKTLDKSLFILRTVKDDVGIDGLTPTEISTILGDKFRIKATSAAISMALSSASSYVDRIRVFIQGGPPAFKYKIMHEGEIYLNDLLKKINEVTTNGN